MSATVPATETRPAADPPIRSFTDPRVEASAAPGSSRARAILLGASRLAPIAAAALLALPSPGADAPSPAPASGPLRLVSPKPTEILSGRQTIEVSVPAAKDGAGAPIVEILVDGRLVAKLDGPPYRTTFDFGESLASRAIEARIAGGQEPGLKARIETRGFDARKVDAVARVDLVTLYATVRNTSGRFITDLTRDQFRVFDGTHEQTLSYFGIERRPLSAAIVVDTSFSMKGEPIEAAREAASRFVRALGPEDRAMVVSFSDRPTILTEPSTDRQLAASALASLEAKGGTALYDTIYSVSDRLSQEDGRKVIVLLSDGRDEAQSGIEPGSLHNFEEALEKALRSEVILFTIGFGKKLETERDFYGRSSLKEILDRLAGDSGGTSYYPQRPSQLKNIYELIGDELRNQYGLAYAPQPLRIDGAWHPIRVELKESSLKAYTRRGYYAPKG